MSEIFVPMPKIARLSRLCTITEKIDGTNASIFISDDMVEFRTASRTRWITPEDDNCGFARWAQEHKEELMQLGPGHHFGEWWGSGIQRMYGQDRKRFSLFNTFRWQPSSIHPGYLLSGDLVKKRTPNCCDVVPVLYEGMFEQSEIIKALEGLRTFGSFAAPGFMNPEGVVVYHQAAKMYFKKTLVGDEKPKGSQEQG